jgi:hypothetical protein
MIGSIDRLRWWCAGPLLPTKSRYWCTTTLDSVLHTGALHHERTRTIRHLYTGVARYSRDGGARGRFL